MQDIRDNFDEIIDIGINDFYFNSEQFIIDLTVLSKYPDNQLDPIRLDMSKNVLPLLKEYNELNEITYLKRLIKISNPKKDKKTIFI